MNVPLHWQRNVWIRVLSHLLFMALCYIVLLNLFKANEEVTPVDHVYTTLFLLTLLPAVYLNLEWLLPKLGNKERWLLYGLLLSAVLITFSWINIQLFDKWSAKLLPDFYFISYYKWWEILAFFTGFVALTTLIKLSKSWFVLNDLQQQLLLLEKDRVDMELAALKAQVNPHFFFNTLNSIYALSLDKDERLPSTVLQLSGIMRYYLYESKGEKVPLEKEVTILKDYIGLQRIRSGEKLDLQLEVEGELTGVQIAPLLLITLVENAFKHGAKGTSGASFIHMKLYRENHQVLFTVSNNKGTVDTPVQEAKGLGLENVKRRLELLYPGRHELLIDETPGVFTIQLKLNV